MNEMNMIESLNSALDNMLEKHDNVVIFGEEPAKSVTPLHCPLAFMNLVSLHPHHPKHLLFVR